jgi:hypothetical protein
MIESRRVRWTWHEGEEDCIYDIGGKATMKETTRKSKTQVGGQY